MNGKLNLSRWAIALLLGGSLSAPVVLQAQNVSVVTTGRKARSKVVPAYPDIARTAHITGKVRIEISIAADGHVASTRVVGGSPVLVSAAVDALEKWHFEPGPADTTETVEFEFSGDN